jgi:outer membrane protein assembly factor BamD (BamD/ComL family)
VDDGVNAYQDGDYAGAIADLMASLAADPDGPAAPAAHFFIARSQQQLNDCTMALAGYEMFLASYPEDDFADDAQFRIGQCHYETGDYATALVDLQKVLDDYGTADAANDAQYTIGLCYLEQAKAMAAGAAQDALLVQARDACGAAITGYPDRSDGTTSPWAQVCIGLTHHEVGDCVAELAAMQKVVSDYPIDPNDPSADPSCTATADHIAACDVNNQRQGALDEANQHITDLNAVAPANHTCL